MEGAKVEADGVELSTRCARRVRMMQGARRRGASQVWCTSVALHMRLFLSQIQAAVFRNLEYGPALPLEPDVFK